MRRIILFLATAVVAVPSIAVPPPVPRPASLLDLRADNCPVDLSGTARPYSPETYRFIGKTGDVLIMVNEKPSLDLAFNLGLVDEGPLIADAGFGPDVRIRLPQSGTYQLQVSPYDPIAKKAVSADFQLRLYLRDEQPIGPCQSGR